MQVGVQRDDEGCARRAKPGGERRGLTRVALERDDVQLGILLPQRLERLEGAVGRAVVHDDHLVAATFQGGRDLGEQRCEIIPLVVRGDHERKLHGVGTIAS